MGFFVLRVNSRYHFDSHHLIHIEPLWGSAFLGDAFVYENAATT
jgi:hypothetical protein